MNHAPICVFAYARLEHTRQLIESLKANPEAASSDLTVFIDAPKNASAVAAVAAVRDYARTITGFASVRTVERTENYGLAKSIITGVTAMLETNESVIVLEDDLVVSSSFLKYMNSGLHRYATDARVASIHGYVYPLLNDPTECFFIRGADCWGWATWRRAWTVFNPNGTELLRELETRHLLNEFDFNGSHAYAKMLRDQIAGKNNSWAIRWNASAFLQNMLTLYPRRTLVENRGFDGTGEHCTQTTDYQVTVFESEMTIESEIPVAASVWGTREFERYFRSIQPSMIKKLGLRLKAMVKRALGFAS